MIRIDRHIRKSVLMAMLVVIGLMVIVDLIFSLAEELSNSDENYSVLNALTFVLWTTPTGIYEFLPYSALGGALIGLGILASNNELIVIRAAGVTTGRIVWAVMKPTLMIMLLSLLLGEYISPRLEQTAESAKAIQRSGEATISSGTGDWRKIGDEFIHINAIAPGGELLYGVTRYRVNADRELMTSSFAQTADFVEDGDTGYWQLSNVQETVFSAQRLTTNQRDQELWDVDLSPELLSVLLVEPDRQSISGLYRFAQFFDSEGLESGTYFLAFWKKLLQPLSTAMLVLLAVSFVFGPLREATMGYRVFVSILIGLVFTIVQQMMEPASLLYGFSPLLAVLAPIVLCALVGVLLLQRVR